MGTLKSDAQKVRPGSSDVHKEPPVDPKNCSEFEARKVNITNIKSTVLFPGLELSTRYYYRKLSTPACYQRAEVTGGERL